MLGRLLDALDCTVVQAADGAEALKVLASTHVDLLVLDYAMPTLNGLDVLRALRASPKHADLPVVLVSGAVNKDAALEAIRFGLVDFLAKPLTFDETKERLRCALQAVGQAASAPRPAVARLPGAGAARPILIVDANAEYRYFVSNVLTSKYSTIQAESGMDAMNVCASTRPAAVLVGTDIGLFGPQLLVQKLRSLAEFSDVKILLVAPNDGTTPVDPSIFDGVLRRSFVPEEFAAQFHEHYERTLGAFALIEQTLISATQQAMGMMAHLDVASVGSADNVVSAGDIVGNVTLRVLQGGTVVQIVLWCSVDSAKRIAARALEAEEETLTAEDGLSMIGETLNVVAGRVQAAIVAEGGTARFTLPEIVIAEESPAPIAADAMLRFESTQRDVSFRIALVDPEHGAVAAA